MRTILAVALLAVAGCGGSEPCRPGQSRCEASQASTCTPAGEWGPWEPCTPLENSGTCETASGPVGCNP